MRIIFIWLVVMVVFQSRIYSQTNFAKSELKAFIKKAGIDSLTITDFLKQETIQLNFSNLTIVSFRAYLFPCVNSDCTKTNDATIVSIKGNTLKSIEFIQMLNQFRKNLPFALVFDQIKFFNAKGELMNVPKALFIKVY